MDKLVYDESQPHPCIDWDLSWDMMESDSQISRVSTQHQLDAIITQIEATVHGVKETITTQTQQAKHGECTVYYTRMLERVPREDRIVIHESCDKT